MLSEIGEDAGARIAAAAAGVMRAEIDSTGGREVFFAGKLDARGVVESVRVCARGVEDAVPAFLEALAPREVVIHNHPSGGVAPSSADLYVAQICGHNGHGVYIVDNPVSRVYVCVEPFLDKDVHLLDPTRLREAFTPTGSLATMLPQFEARPQQIEMMTKVADAFNNDRIAVIEAPTGIGKTFAYLVPAIEWAVNNRERVVVSTRTINLQEQLIFKDIPVLQKCLGIKFNAVLVKGRNNYVCLRRFERAVSELFYDDEATQAAVEKLSEWVQKTEDGSRSDLSFVPPRDLWERICSEADSCTGNYCPMAKRCFVMRARRELAKADIIVANHHILFSDISVKWDAGEFHTLGVLPAYKRVILDEAHSVEDSATEYFGVDATRNGAANLFGRFYRKERTHERGLLPFIKAKVVKDHRVALSQSEQILGQIDNLVLPALGAARESVLGMFQALRELAGAKCGQIGRDVKWRLTEKVLAESEVRRFHETHVAGAAADVAELARHGAALVTMMKQVKPANDDPEPPLLPEIYELSGYCSRLTRLEAVLREGTSEQIAENTVRWIEIDSAAPNTVRIVRCPLEVGGQLNEAAYANLRTVVMTSATLSVQRRFDYFLNRIGLDAMPDNRITMAALDTPFDFGRQAMLAITRDLPSPEEPAFLDATVAALREVFKITKGHALVLFTSFYALDYAHKRLEKELRAAGIAPLKQGQESRTQTLNRFRDDSSSVLFATDSFWEGIDVAGDALQCVILPRLPFRVPTEPIQQARAEAIDAVGGNSFLAYTVPQAVIKFRQGFGRLIRRKSDRGTIVVLDRRVAEKFYGKMFLASLPGIRVVSGPGPAVYTALEAFHANKERGRK